MRRACALFVAPLTGCPAVPPRDSAPCVPPWGVFTDIDETLTTSDQEWLDQIADPTHDPAMRPDADLLMRGYAERGYTVFYVTARGEDVALSDGRSARQATSDWLDAHGFPWSEDAVFLAEGIGVYGDAAVEYKSGVILGLAEEGWQPAWAYGNAESDILAFQAAGIPDDHIFLVGALAGTMGVEPILDDDAYSAHLEHQLPLVESVSCP